jgi:hypothetical protein
MKNWIDHSERKTGRARAAFRLPACRQRRLACPAVRLPIRRNAATSGPSAVEHRLSPWPTTWEEACGPQD